MGPLFFSPGIKLNDCSTSSPPESPQVDVLSLGGLGWEVGWGMPYLDDGFGPHHFQHLPAPGRAVGEREVDDLRVLGELQGDERGQG